MSEIKSHTQPGKASRTGEVEIEQILLVTRDNEDFDITLMLGELNLFGELLSPFHTASLLLVDNVGLLHNAPLNGEEIIVITLKASSTQAVQSITKAYKVVSVENINIASEGATAAYDLNLISLLGYVNGLSKIKKKFSGNCTDLVLQITDEYLYEPYMNLVRDMPEPVVATEKMFTDFFEYNHMTASNKTTFVSCGWTPGFAINWIAARAIGITPNEKGKESAGYVFTESFTELHYKTIEEMYFKNRIKASPAYDDILGIWRFEYFPASASQNPSRNYKSIIDFSFKRYNNLLLAHKSGVLASQLETYDVITKRYRKQQIDWVEEHVEHARLEDYEERAGIHFPAIGRKTFMFSDNVARIYEAKSFKTVTHNQLFDGFSGYEPERIVQQRHYTFDVLNQMTLDVTVYGRLEMQQGSVVHLNFPVNTATPDKAAEYISGYYVVTAVRHKITFNEHFTYIEVAKDSTRAEL
jgi:hypothetical protein